jgi:hypothetical protein
MALQWENRLEDNISDDKEPRTETAGYQVLGVE